MEIPAYNLAKQLTKNLDIRVRVEQLFHQHPTTVPLENQRSIIENEIMVSFDVIALFISIDSELEKEFMAAVPHNTQDLAKK